jgi:hypothetical protein
MSFDLRKFGFGRIAVLLLLLIVMGSSVSAEEVAVDPVAAAIDAAKAEMQNNINIVWTCIAAFLVFFMQAGFAMVEAGFTRAKNAINILMKNLMDFSIGTLAFFFIGFSLMFGASKGLFGWDGFGLNGVEGDGSHWNWTFLIFQTVFAGTAATIVSGAMAGRTRFKAYICYSVFICAFIYPIFGSWAWGSLLNGGGWLENMGFCDFAGSTVVHSVGGWLALAGGIGCLHSVVRLVWFQCGIDDSRRWRDWPCGCDHESGCCCGCDRCHGRFLDHRKETGRLDVFKWSVGRSGRDYCRLLYGDSCGCDRDWGDSRCFGLFQRHIYR